MYFPRCLAIPEILLRICEELAPEDITGDTPITGQQSLVELSLTNKRFQDTALNRLWGTQTSLSPLLKCFPPDSWTPRNSYDFNGLEVEADTIAFTRLIRPEDWERVGFYARRIHDLRLSKAEMELLSPDFWLILSSSLPPNVKSLLPELRFLQYPDTNNVFHTFNLVIPHHLNGLTISLNGPLALRMTSIQSLPTLCPNLKALEIQDYRSQSMTGLSPVLSKLKSLRHLKIGPITRKPLHWVAAHLPALETIEISFGLQNGKDFREKPLPPGIFPRLRQATFKNINLSLVPQIILPLASGSLSDIKIHAIRGGHEEQFQQTIAALEHLSDTLEIVEIRECHPTSIINNTALTCKAFQPLLSLFKLKSLQLSTMTPVSLTDDFLQELGESCQGLRVLEIAHRTSRTNGDVSAPTLLGLLPLLEHCRELNRLTLYIDADQDPYDGRPRSTFPITSHSLTSLNVVSSPASDSVNIAAFLATVTPNLREVHWAVGTTSDATWLRVEQHLEVVRRIRA